jgi:hypothetical protein
MEDRKIGPIIGQAMNILAAQDPEFRQQLMDVHIACDEHKAMNYNPLENTEYSKECVKCNHNVMVFQSKVERMTKRLLRVSLAIETSMKFEQQKKEEYVKSQTPVQLTHLTPHEAGLRFDNKGRYKLYKDKQCSLSETEHVLLYVANPPVMEQGGQFAKYILPCWFAKEDVNQVQKGISLEIPQSSFSYLQQLNVKTGDTLDVTGKVIDGAYGRRCAAQWKKIP